MGLYFYSRGFWLQISCKTHNRPCRTAVAKIANGNLKTFWAKMSTKRTSSARTTAFRGTCLRFSLWIANTPGGVWRKIIHKSSRFDASLSALFSTFGLPCKKSQNKREDCEKQVWPGHTEQKCKNKKTEHRWHAEGAKTPYIKTSTIFSFKLLLCFIDRY